MLADDSGSSTSAALGSFNEFETLAKQLFEVSAELAVSSRDRAAEEALSIMRRLVECDERLQVQLEAVGARHAMHLRIAAEAAAAEECESKIKELSSGLCKAEKMLETMIMSTTSMLDSAKKASESAPSAADIVCTAQRIAFTSTLIPHLQPMDCRFRHPWPTEGELRTSRHLFAQTEVPEEAMQAPEVPRSPSLKRPAPEEPEMEGLASPTAKSPKKKAPTKQVDLTGSMFAVEESSDSDSDSGSD